MLFSNNRKKFTIWKFIIKSIGPFGEIFILPEYIIQEEGAIVPGLDGRKMSKSYGNVIPLFEEPEKLKKLIFKIKTDSSLSSEPKELETLFMLYKEFATAEELQK